MARHVVLLRGINLGSRNRIAMPELRDHADGRRLRRREDLPPERQRRALELEAAAVAPERLVAAGRELYAWHPDGIGPSKLWARLAGRGLGVTATARNWTTVTKLLELADEFSPPRSSKEKPAKRKDTR
jgi:uncharacterized protein (DUF1697 family)